MTTVQLHLIVRYQGRQIVEDVVESSSATVEAVLNSILTRHGFPLGPGWVVRFEGRSLPRSARLAEALPDSVRERLVTLEITAGTLVSLPAPDNGEVDLALVRPCLDEAAPDEERGDFDLALEESAAEADDESGSQVVALEDEEETEPEPAADECADVEEMAASAAPARAAVPRTPAAAAPRKVERQATVRYYSRMNPQRMYPLFVVISEKKLLEVVKKYVEQATSKRFRVALDSTVEVEPILPGCDCYPPRESVRVGKGEATATFYVVPHVLGKVLSPRVVVRQGGEVLAEVPLQVRVVRQSAAVVMCLVTLLLPFVSSVMKHYHIDFESQLQEGFSAYARAAQFVTGSLSPGVMTLALLGMTCGTYLWFRPRRRETFFDITPVTPQEQYQLGIDTINAGDENKGTEIIWRLLKAAPDFQPAWFFCAERYAAYGDDKEALRCYGKGLALGKADAKVYVSAASTAGKVGKTARALAILAEAQQLLGPCKNTGVMWYNMGCYATRLGQYDEAMRHLGRAVQTGYRKAEQYRKDRDLAPLRKRADFQKLLASLGA